jgi:hypothetical protein
MKETGQKRSQLTNIGPTASGSFTVHADGTRQPGGVTGLSNAKGQ